MCGKLPSGNRVARQGQGQIFLSMNRASRSNLLLSLSAIQRFLSQHMFFAFGVSFFLLLRFMAPVHKPDLSNTSGENENARCVKARLHMRVLMRFPMRFREQNAPYPTLHECFFREVSRGLGRKLSHIICRHPSFKFLLAWRYFVAALRD